MNIQILNNDLSLFGIAAGFERVEFERAFNSKGRFKLKINANNQSAKYIKIDKIAYIDKDKIAYIDKVTLDRKSSKADEYIIAEGVEIKDRLSRLIYPPAGQETDSYTDEYLETIIKSLIDKNAGCLASTDRQIPNLVTAANSSRGARIDYSARFKDLSTEIYSLLASQEMGLKASIDFDSGEIVFDVAQGNDLTAVEGQAGGIVLSLDTKTALEIVDTDDRLNYKNLSVIARSDDVHEYGTSSGGYDRREVFTEARDANTNDEFETRALQKLSDISKTRGISVSANSLGAYEIGDDYDLGDYISVDSKGELCNGQVIKIAHKYSNDSAPEVNIVLNFDAEDSLISDIRAKHMDYDALLAKDAESSNKNLIINGNFDRWIRGTSFTASEYTADRWRKTSGGTVTRVAVNEANSKYALRYAGDGTGLYLWQYIENPNNELYNKKSTLSFWVKGSVTFSNANARLRNDTQAIEINSIEYDITTEWTKHVVTFDASTQWANGDIIRLYLLSNDPIANGEWVQFKQAKFEVGETATDFVPQTIAELDAQCNRYAQLSVVDQRAQVVDANQGGLIFPIRETMRIDPTVVFKSNVYAHLQSGGAAQLIFSPGNTSSGNQVGDAIVADTVTLTCSAGDIVQFNNSATSGNNWSGLCEVLLDAEI